MFVTKTIIVKIFTIKNRLKILYFDFFNKNEHSVLLVIHSSSHGKNTFRGPIRQNISKLSSYTGIIIHNYDIILYRYAGNSIKLTNFTKSLRLFKILSNLDNFHKKINLVQNKKGISTNQKESVLNSEVQCSVSMLQYIIRDSSSSRFSTKL